MTVQATIADIFSLQNAITHIFEMAAGPVRELFGRGQLEDNDMMGGEDATDSSVTTTKEDEIEGMKYFVFLTQEDTIMQLVFL